MVSKIEMVYTRGDFGVAERVCSGWGVYRIPLDDGPSVLLKVIHPGCGGLSRAIKAAQKLANALEDGVRDEETPEDDTAWDALIREAREVHDDERDNMTDNPRLWDRGLTHGPYPRTAPVSSQIKAALRTGVAYDDAGPIVQEALDQIAVKLARIVSGDPEYRDHWVDIAGYADLVLDWWDGDGDA